MININRHPDRDALATAVVDDIALMIANDGVRGHIRIALAGGSTPTSILPHLFARTDLPWADVVLSVSDERQVPYGDPLSNGGQVERLRAGTPAAAATFVPLDRLVPGALDVVWAGVGADGHTLSWFPGPDLEAALNSPLAVVPVQPDPLPEAAPVSRLTLTRRSVAAARMVMIAATGADKLAVLENPADLPIGALFDAVLSPRIHWAP